MPNLEIMTIAELFSALHSGVISERLIHIEIERREMAEKSAFERFLLGWPIKKSRLRNHAEQEYDRREAARSGMSVDEWRGIMFG